MSPPISDRIVVADKTLTPGFVHRRLTRDRKVARPAYLLVHPGDCGIDHLIDLEPLHPRRRTAPNEAEA
jgi:hypothetical protein